MRTTLSIDDHLLDEAKRRARGVAVGTVVDDALRRDFQRREGATERPKIPVFVGTGTQPGVDLTSARALRELLDEGTELDKLR